MRIYALIPAVLLAGCAGRPLDLPARTPELMQVIAEAKDAPGISRRLSALGYSRIVIAGNPAEAAKWTPQTSDRFIMYWRHFTAPPQVLKDGSIGYTLKKSAQGAPRTLGLDEPPLLNTLSGDGDLLVRRGKWREAAQAFEKSRRQAPSLPLLHARLGDCHTRLGNYGAAFSSYSRAIAMGGPNPGIFSAMGEMHQKFGRKPESEDAFEKAAGLDPDNPERWIRLARSRLRNGKKAPAMKAVDRALALDPAYAPALELKSGMGNRP